MDYYNNQNNNSQFNTTNQQQQYQQQQPQAPTTGFQSKPQQQHQPPQYQKNFQHQQQQFFQQQQQYPQNDILPAQHHNHHQQQQEFVNQHQPQQQQQQQYYPTAFVQPVLFAPVPVQFPQQPPQAQHHQQQQQQQEAAVVSPQQQEKAYRWEPYRRSSNASSTPGSSLNASVNQEASVAVLSPKTHATSPSAGPTALTVIGVPPSHGHILSASASVNSGLNDDARSENSDIVPNVIIRKGHNRRGGGSVMHTTAQNNSSSSSSSSDDDDDAPLTTPAFTEGRDLVLSYRSYGVGEQQHNTNSSSRSLLEVLRQQVPKKALKNMLKFCVNSNFSMMGAIENPNSNTLPVIDELCCQYRGNIVVELVALFPEHRLVNQLLEYIVRHLTVLSEDPLGSNTLVRVYEVAPVFFKDQISTIVMNNFVKCATHPHANFLVSKVIQVSLMKSSSSSSSSTNNGAPSVLAHLTSIFSSAVEGGQNTFISLAKDKYGSHALESWIECCPDASFFVMLQMLLEPVPSTLEELQERQQQLQQAEQQLDSLDLRYKKRANSQSTLFILSNDLLGNYPLQRVFRRMHRLAAACGVQAAPMSSADESTESLPVVDASSSSLVPEQVEQLKEMINKSTLISPKVIKHSLYCSQVQKAIKNKGSNKKLNPLC